MRKFLPPLVSEVVEIKSNRALYADGYSKVLEYGDRKIVISNGKTDITVTGKGLTVKYLNGEKLSIHGIIRSVEYDKADS